MDEKLINSEETVSKLSNLPAYYKQPAKSRRDIQGLRAVAMTAVFLFHLWPKIFTNGFLGVDMFFAISGFLMAQILSKFDCFSTKDIADFYERRVRRIVPIFGLISCVVIFAGSFLLTDDDFRVLREDAVPSLTFTANIRTLFEKDDYWAQVFSYRIFLHHWSLGVEMQFYILVPIIFYFLLKFKGTRRRCLASFAVVIASLILQIFSSQTIAFNLVFARIWEFFVGICAFFYTQHRDGKSTAAKYGKIRVFAVLQLLLLVLVLFMPSFQRLPHFQQTTVVVATSFLLALDLPHFGVQITVLENRAITKAGDWSYVWYLVHWPIIEFWRYWSVDNDVTMADGLAITMIVLVFVAVFEFVDSKIRRIASFSSIFMLISIFYLICFAFMFLSSRHAGSKSSTSPTIDANYTRNFIEQLYNTNNRSNILRRLKLGEQIALNKNMRQLNLQFLNCSEFNQPSQCIFQGTGKFRALLVGDSHAALSRPVIVSTFANHFNQLRQLWTHGCIPANIYHPTDAEDTRCRLFVNTVLEMIDREQPQIVFVQFMWWNIMEQPIALPPQNDIFVAAFRHLIAKLEQYAKVIYIGEPSLYFKYAIAQELGKRLKQGMPLDKLDMKLSDHQNRRQFSYARLSLFKCPTCFVLPWSDAFCDRKANICRAFDAESKLAYFEDNHHWSYYGMLLVNPLLQRLSDELKQRNSNFTL